MISSKLQALTPIPAKLTEQCYSGPDKIRQFLKLENNELPFKIKSKTATALNAGFQPRPSPLQNFCYLIVLFSRFCPFFSFFLSLHNWITWAAGLDIDIEYDFSPCFNRR
jgi:hypothetical protein